MAETGRLGEAPAEYGPVRHRLTRLTMLSGPWSFRRAAILQAQYPQKA